jgi:hypothetical protein
MRKPKPRQAAAAKPAAAPILIGDDDTPLTPSQVCGLFAISLVSLWRMVKKKELPAPFYPRPRSPRWTLGDLRMARERMRMLPSEAKAAHRAAKLRAAAASPATGM